MKKVLLSLLAVATVSLTSCNRDGDGPVETQKERIIRLNRDAVESGISETRQAFIQTQIQSLENGLLSQALRELQNRELTIVDNPQGTTGIYVSYGGLYFKVYERQGRLRFKPFKQIYGDAVAFLKDNGNHRIFNTLDDVLAFLDAQ